MVLALAIEYHRALNIMTSLLFVAIRILWMGLGLVLESGWLMAQFVLISQSVVHPEISAQKVISLLATDYVARKVLRAVALRSRLHLHG